MKELIIALFVLAFVGQVSAEDMKEASENGFKKFGNSVKEAGRDVGHGFRDAGKKIGKGSEAAGKEVASESKEAGKKTESWWNSLWTDDEK